VATAFWGLYAVGFAQFGGSFGALIEAVNKVGSFFYGGLLGVFVLAFFFKKVTANGAFYGVIAGEIAIFSVKLFTNTAFLWLNVIGPLVVVGVGVLVSRLERERSRLKVAW
jgi:solute:Na+ symporter, SSS family